MSKKRSIKTKVFIILVELLVPLIVLIIIYSIFMMNEFREKLEASSENALNIFCSNLENELENLNKIFVRTVSIDDNLKMLNRKESTLNAHLQSYEICQNYSSLLETNEILCGCMIISYPNNLFRCVYGESVTDHVTKSELENYFRDCTESTEPIKIDGWHPLTVGDRNFLYLVGGYQGVYAVYLVDLDEVRLSQGEGEVVFLADGQPMTISDGIRDNHIVFKNQENAYYSGKRQRYMIVERPLQNTTVRAAYLTSYEGILGGASQIQALLFLAPLISAAMIPFGYYKMKKIFFQPVDKLIDTMNKIKSGKLEVRADSDYDEIEFREMDDTFNSMIEQINSLKNEAYERELHLREVQLQYYQIQIKPHFYMNCLKNMYGIMEEERYEDMKKSIIYLSKHLRNMLKNDTMVVSIREELEYIKDYIMLQRLNAAYPLKIEADVDETVLDQKIPAISLLSFVENCIKHGAKGRETLKIWLRISKKVLEEDSYLSLQVLDNGKGFEEKELGYLNRPVENQMQTHSIGIYNVVSRYNLYFGRENVWFAFSNNHGACIDIFIKQKSGKDNKNEHTAGGRPNECS